MKRLALPAALLIALSTHTRALETDGLVRDPSTIIKRGDTYWVYGTGAGTQQYSSKDRLHWTNHGPALPTAPAWVATAVPGNKDNVVWAPDVFQKNGKYFLYYSYSAWGSNQSAIGVAINRSNSLDPKGWVDQGIVFASTGREGINAIDPGITEDFEGRMWMSFGSYVTGLRLIELDPSTGKRIAPDSPVTLIARHPAGDGAAIEASYIYPHDGWYTLFVNWDACCAQARSSYNIRVGRSKSITGPYLDKSGKSMAEGGGTLFLNAMHDNGSGRPIDDQVGPGHAGILREGNDYWLSTHYEWSRSKDGRTTMNVQRLTWDADGWPRAVLDEGPWKMVSNLPSHTIAEAKGNAPRTGSRLQTAPYEAKAGQRWRLRHLGEGLYAILSAQGGLALGTVGGSNQPGAKVELAAWANRDSQKWFAQRNDDGTVTFLSQNSNRTQALDVAGCNPSDGVEIQTWNSNGLDCQKWSLRLK